MTATANYVPAHRGGAKVFRPATRRLIGMAAIGLGLLGACTSGDDSPATETKAPASSEPAPTTTDGAQTTKGTTSTPAEGAVKDLSGFRCQADAKGQWSATGKITNSGSSADTYTLVVSVYSTKTSTVSSETTKTFDLKPQQTSTFSLDAFALAKGKDLDCAAQVTKPKG